MNVLDVIMLLGLVTGVAIGFVRGLVQQTMGLLSIYVSMVVGVWAHNLFGNAFKSVMPALSWPAARFLGFLTALIIVLNALGFVARDIERNAEWIEKIPPIVNQVGGLTLGFATAAFWLGVLSMALSIIGHAPWVGAEEAGRTLVILVDDSILAYVFRYAFWLGLHTVSPWIPGGLPDILTSPF